MPFQALTAELPDPARSEPEPQVSGGRAADLDERRRSFLRAASHELRTPLNAVIGFSEIIERELHGPLGDPRYRGHAAVIRDSGLRLLKLVNQVLEIARLDAGAADLDLRPEPAATAIDAAIRTLTCLAEERGVTFEVNVAPDTPLVLADARGLETLLQNLLHNAVTFSPPGRAVEVSARNWRNGVMFEIRDHGPGVPSNEVARLIRPFEQGENALVRRAQGTGLGLAIVSLLCREMGGRLSISSALGAGLTARVRLCAAARASPSA